LVSNHKGISGVYSGGTESYSAGIEYDAATSHLLHTLPQFTKIRSGAPVTSRLDVIPINRLIASQSLGHSRVGNTQSEFIVNCGCHRWIRGDSRQNFL